MVSLVLFYLTPIKIKYHAKLAHGFYVDLVAGSNRYKIVPFFKKLLWKWKTIMQFTGSGSQIIMSNVATCQSSTTGELVQGRCSCRDLKLAVILPIPSEWFKYVPTTLKGLCIYKLLRDPQPPPFPRVCL